MKKYDVIIIGGGHAGTEAALALLEHSFLNLGMYRCWVDIPEFNINAVKLFEKIGIWNFDLGNSLCL